jgi:hypothetical protein
MSYIYSYVDFGMGRFCGRMSCVKCVTVRSCGGVRNITKRHRIMVNTHQGGNAVGRVDRNHEYQGEHVSPSS